MSGQAPLFISELNVQLQIINRRIDEVLARRSLDAFGDSHYANPQDRDKIRELKKRRNEIEDLILQVRPEGGQKPKA